MVNRRPPRWFGGFVVYLTVLWAASVQAQHGAPASGEWPTYGGDLGNTKYSPLDQIDKDNFGDLEIAWRWSSIDGFLSMADPSGGEWSSSSENIFDELNKLDPDRWRDGQHPFSSGLKATPLMVGGVIYLNTPLSIGVALDARTGAQLWVYNPKSYESGTTTMSARWNQRGVAYWTDGTEERIYWGTGDCFLIAVDAKTGQPIADFGENGRVDLMEGIPRANRGERDWLNALLYSVQSPPIVVRNTVITPMSISSYNNKKEMPPGWMRGFDVRTGEMKWVFHTIPQADEFGNETWQGDA